MSELYKDAIAGMYKDIDMPGGWKFNHINTLKQIDLFSNSKYKTGELDEQGFYKFFVDISTPTCDVASKFIDIDIQNIRFLPRPSMDNDVTINEMMAYHMSKDFKVYADENKLGSLMNELGDDLPKYGSIFVKDVRGVPMRVAPHNIKFDPGAKNLKSSSFVAEPYLMRKSEILAMRGKWNKLENFQTAIDRGETELYLVYEFYENYGTEWKRTVRTDIFCWKGQDGSIARSLESNINYQGEELPSIVLHEDKMKKLPYYDHKWKNVDGRLLGLGYMEYLFPNQIATNEAENLERKGLYYSSLVLLQTRDQAIGGKNVLTSTQNGDILTIDSEVTKIPMEERNLAAYNATRSRWDNNTALKTFSHDIATGNNLPSRTPMGVANMQASMVMSFYDKKRENYGMFWKDTILKEIVIPSFKNKTAKEHILTIGSSEKDIEGYIKFLTKVLLEKKVADYAESNGYFPSIEQRKTIEGQISDELRSRKNHSIQIEDFAYDNVAYNLEIDITGESVDTGVKSQMMQALLQIIGTNPAILQNDTTRSILMRFMALGGINPDEVGLDMSSVDKTPVPQGGSISTNTAMPMSQSQTLQ